MTGSSDFDMPPVPDGVQGEEKPPFEATNVMIASIPETTNAGPSQASPACDVILNGPEAKAAVAALKEELSKALLDEMAKDLAKPNALDELGKLLVTPSAVEQARLAVVVPPPVKAVISLPPPPPPPGTMKMPPPPPPVGSMPKPPPPPGPPAAPSLIGMLPKTGNPEAPPPPNGLCLDPAAVAQMLFSSMVLYGPTGTRKTKSIGDLATYIYEKFGKQTRLITADGGGYYTIQNYVNAGIIEPWRINEEENPKVCLRKASKGWWPKKLKNGLRMSNEFHQPSRDQRAVSMMDVAAYAIEGWASVCSLIMGDTVSKGQKVSQEIVGRFTEETVWGEEVYGAPAPSHYGFVQRELLDLIRNFGGLPLERVLYTSIEGKGEDKLTKTTQYGPAAAGQAITAVIPTYVGDCLHYEDVTESSAAVAVGDSKTQKLVTADVRVWFTQHPDIQTGIMWPAKPRVIASQYAEFRKRLGVNGFFKLDDKTNLYTYLKLQDELLESGSNELLEWKQRMDAERAAKLVKV